MSFHLEIHKDATKDSVRLRMEVTYMSTDPIGSGDREPVAAVLVIASGILVGFPHIHSVPRITILWKDLRRNGYFLLCFE